MLPVIQVMKPYTYIDIFPRDKTGGGSVDDV